MKKLSKLVVAASVATAIFIGSSAKAQTTTTTTTSTDSQNAWRLGIGIEGGIPVGSYSTAGTNALLGGTARLQYDIKGSFSVMLTSGYYNIFVKDEAEATGADQGVIPVKAGVKWFFVPNWYVSGEAGAAIETKYDKQTRLLLSPGIGYATNSGWDIGARYENFSGGKSQGFDEHSYGFAALRLAYAFKL